ATPTPEPAGDKAETSSQKAAPRRHWVQIAGGADKEALPRAFARLKEQAPGLLSGKTAWTTPLRFTNRLLVGPFKSEAEAQAFVNELAEVELAAFSWTSEEGQEIEKLSAN
ncbi:SPOR domain-containing protein, partial [Allosphingosinicella sp.]|uniref:SPOR domain-containing protein n=1 Tax=Allosphingosinicella sp. TaxID=2823234 RepID=UPI002FC1DA91